MATSTRLPQELIDSIFDLALPDAIQVPEDIETCLNLRAAYLTVSSKLETDLPAHHLLVDINIDWKHTPTQQGPAYAIRHQINNVIYASLRPRDFFTHHVISASLDILCGMAYSGNEVGGQAARVAKWLFEVAHVEFVDTQANTTWKYQLESVNRQMAKMIEEVFGPKEE